MKDTLLQQSPGNADDKSQVKPTSQCLLHLLVDNDVDPHTPLSSLEKHPVEAISLILCWRPSQIQLGR